MSQGRARLIIHGLPFHTPPPRLLLVDCARTFEKVASWIGSRTKSDRQNGPGQGLARLGFEWETKEQGLLHCFRRPVERLLTNGLRPLAPKGQSFVQRPRTHAADSVGHPAKVFCAKCGQAKRNRRNARQHGDARGLHATSGLGCSYPWLEESDVAAAGDGP